jgi:hypothetical protein
VTEFVRRVKWGGVDWYFVSTPVGNRTERGMRYACAIDLRG